MVGLGEQSVEPQGTRASRAGRPRGWLRRRAAAVALLLVGGSLGCWQSGPPEDPGDVKVAEITLGRAIAPDGTIVDDSRTNMFWVTDTFYVSVATTGSAPSVRLKARWLSQDGTVVSESTKTITPQGPMATAFQASPSDRWPAGDYKVEVFLNDASAGTRDLNAR